MAQHPQAFDKIIVTCSPEDIPQPLVVQLREGGRMVIPVGNQFSQDLTRVYKDRNGIPFTKAEVFES